MKLATLAALGLLAATPVLAQGIDAGAPLGFGAPRITTPGQEPETIVEQGGPGIANGGPEATGTIAHSGLGADSISNNSAGSGNASRPELGVPNLGGGGGDGSNNQ